ncbi:ABC transporter permease [Actinoalloteichus spitiensis]|uniref:ABC transporter permease n=1 Tax=Actinoalloteichus spitiensis TaxID=252394 RepID=UPI00037112F8|nr:ABC transporter permease [Actinoalloteichus spitiensis]
MSVQTMPWLTPAPPLPSPVHRAASASAVLVGRGLRHLRRSPEQVVLAVAVPASILLIFRYLFGGAIDTGGAYVDYLISGVLAIGVGISAMSTTSSVSQDMTNGIVDRFRSLPMPASAVLVGHVVATVARGLISLTTLILVGLLVGFRPSAGVVEWLLAIGLLVLFALGFAWLAALLGLLANSVDAASGYGTILLFLPQASSAFVPPETMPTALRVFVENQPISLVIDAVRGLLLGVPADGAGVAAVIWWTAIIAVAVPLAAVLYRRRALG